MRPENELDFATAKGSLKYCKWISEISKLCKQFDLKRLIKQKRNREVEKKQNRVLRQDSNVTWLARDVLCNQDNSNEIKDTKTVQS